MHCARVFLAGLLLPALFIGVLLAASPQLHALVHSDATSPGHECVVTLLASGKIQQSDAPTMIVAPTPVVLISRIAPLHPIWVAAPFLSASIFEHAPPALS